MSRLLAALAVVVTLVTVLAFIGWRSDSGGESALRAIGRPAAEVCRAETDHPATGASQHVPGEVTYDRTPPNSGPHAPNWLVPNRRVYTLGDVPPVERVVHNLEHGYVVVWYDPARSDGSALTSALEAAETKKLFAVPWIRSPLPAPFVLTAWGQERQCDDVSGEAIADFVAAHGGGNGNAPEPNAP